MLIISYLMLLNLTNVIVYVLNQFTRTTLKRKNFSKKLSSFKSKSHCTMIYPVNFKDFLLTRSEYKGERIMLNLNRL